jgi:hypothetical protein
VSTLPSPRTLSDPDAENLSNQAARSVSIFIEDRRVLSSLAFDARLTGKNEVKPWFVEEFRESYLRSVLDLKTAKA